MITQATPPCAVGKWFGANHHIAPFGGVLSLLSETVRFPGFSTPPPFCWKGGSSTLCTPFLHPLCAPLSALEPPFCTLSAHPLCEGTPFLHPLYGGVSGQGFLQEGHPMHPPGSNLVSQAYMRCLALRSFVVSPRASLCRAARCRNPTSRVSVFNTWVRAHRETRGRPWHHPRMLFLTASLKGLCLCSAGILLNT